MDGKSNVEELVYQIGKLFLFYIVFACSVVFGGFVVHYLWNGIITPTFGLTTITVMQGAGVDTLVSFIVMSGAKKEDNEKLSEKVARIIVINLTVLLMGFIIMKFI